mmetsp:Transcript_28820/g.33278  ORF Transcript_28820/g.33278 Transcript_28820/m.33278 type:complete len:897 (+) Transcript_28820:42-2732(+)|eukprot:CAMPEP_0176425098 /NCGR_PEP_ID=MMETSP0127-20121128/11208_1 /TAXON_ID=938130 /ORGANISM="Platyophrya macrostoma, Strain WH" /LENGTH=896 /DNA_ID=CAMNT_0017806237 /DNA_START=37 /DNA_END=2727 /DNA_ORIENTATION=-
MSSTKLRELIKGVRGCKTAAEERALVQKEKAAIRNSFQDEDSEARARNIAKLVFIYLLGHDTDFGQLECLKLITSSNYTEKKIGYLGLTQLFSEKSEILMMATNRMRMDLQSGQNYVIALALQALGEITSADMCRELAPEVLKLMVSGNTYIKKKTALAASRIIKKIPELTEEFSEKVGPLLEERHHGVMLATLGLVEDVLNINVAHKKIFKKNLTLLIKVLKSLVSNYTAEYDISGVVDPFLQVQILRVFRQMAKGDEAISDEISEVLALVATNTPSNKNTGNAVLFECVTTILTIESSNTLRTLAVNILAKFLASKESNSKYVSLVSLQRVVRIDQATVQKHKNTILDCLRENDISIKRHALLLLCEIVNESNVKSIVKEMLNYLLISETDFLQELTLKICTCVEKFSPSRRWHIDVIIRVLTIAGKYVKDESVNNLIHLIAATPELHTYCVLKLYYSALENMNQDGLVKVALWCIGEHGIDLVNGKAKGPDGASMVLKEHEVLALVEKILNLVNVSESIKEFALNCLIKLYPVFNSSKDKIKALIDSQTTSAYLEVQQRACEYLQLLESEWDKVRAAIVEKMPICSAVTKDFANKPIGEKDVDDLTPLVKDSKSSSQSANLISSSVDVRKENAVQDLLDLDSLEPDQIEDTSKSGTATTTGSTTSSNLFELDFGGGGSVSKPTTNLSSGNILDLYGGGNQMQGGGMGVNFNAGGQFSNMQAFPTSGGLGMMDFGGAQINPTPVTTTTTKANSGFDLLDNLDDFGSMQSASNQNSNKNLTLTVFQDGNITVVFTCSKDSEDTTNINTVFDNNTGSQITDLVFQVAVQKHLKLTLNPLSGTKIPAGAKAGVTQSMKIQNTKQGEKSIVLKLKMNYKLDSQTISREATVNQFPQDY